MLWTVLNPLFMMLIIAFVFSAIFRHSIEHFPVYYLCGWLVFNFNSDATTGAIYSVVDNSAVLKKIYIPPYIFCISKVILAMINLIISALPLFAIMLFTGVRFSRALLWIPVALIPLFFFSLGLGLALSAMAVYFRDMFYLYNIVLMAWMYLSAIFYPIEIIPQEFRVLWNFNPLYNYIVLLRGFVLDGSPPNTETALYACCFSFIAMGLGVTIFKRLQKGFILHF